MIQAIIDHTVCINNDTIIILADAEKCFDKMWLKDTFNELFIIGLSVAEIKLLKRMHRRAIATIETQAVPMDKIIFDNIVKYCTIMDHFFAL